MTMQRLLRHGLVPLLTLQALTFLANVSAAFGDDLNHHLHDLYQGKMFVLQNFYTRDSLHFSSSGTVLDNVVSGDWTIDGIVLINEIAISNGRLEINGTRIHVGWLRASGFTILNDLTGKSAKDEKRRYAVRIESDLDANDPSSQQVDALFSRIFLARGDSIVDSLPSYWKPCLHDGLSGNEIFSDACRFSPALLRIPGLFGGIDNASHVSEPSVGEQNGSTATIGSLGNGGTPPHVISSQEPPPNELSRARRFQGTVRLSVVVDEHGLPKNIRVIQPLGCGLDADAVHAVGGWRFDPAQRGGKPVAFQITVEIAFHLY